MCPNVIDLRRYVLFLSFGPFSILLSRVDDYLLIIHLVVDNFRQFLDFSYVHLLLTYMLFLFS